MARDWDTGERALINATNEAFKRSNALMPGVSPQVPGGTPMAESSDLTVYYEAGEDFKKAQAALDAFREERRLHDPTWPGA